MDPVKTVARLLMCASKVRRVYIEAGWEVAIAFVAGVCFLNPWYFCALVFCVIP